jgi:hypothetical protein
MWELAGRRGDGESDAGKLETDEDRRRENAMKRKPGFSQQMWYPGTRRRRRCRRRRRRRRRIRV